MHYIFIIGYALAAFSISIPLTIILIGCFWGCILAFYHLWDAFVEAHSIEK